MVSAWRLPADDRHRIPSEARVHKRLLKWTDTGYLRHGTVQARHRGRLKKSSVDVVFPLLHLSMGGEDDGIVVSHHSWVTENSQRRLHKDAS